MKTIIELATKAGFWTTTAFVEYHAQHLKNFATLVKDAHTDELLEGVEMPEPAYQHWGRGIEPVVGYTLDQIRETVAAAVLRKDAEMRQMGEDLIAIQTMHNEQKARLYEKCADLRNERDTLKAENEQLEADAARYQWLRVQSNSDEIGVSNYIDGLWFFELNEAGIDAAIDAAMKGQP